MTKKKKALIAICTAALLLAFAASPLAACMRSMVAMSFISSQNTKESFQVEKGFTLEIPSGPGWYPLVLTHNADRAFQRLTGADGARLSILYNFPAFDHIKGCSRLFDESSPYYNSFYGAYLTSLPAGGAYGFDPDSPGLSTAAADLAQLDFFGLVLSDFGIENVEKVFEYKLESEIQDISLLGYTGWTRADASLRVNGASHEAIPGVRSYWQYGKPRFPVSEPLAPVDMCCTVIARYFDEFESTVFFYVMAPDRAVADYCVENIFPNSVHTPIGN